MLYFLYFRCLKANVNQSAKSLNATGNAKDLPIAPSQAASLSAILQTANPIKLKAAIIVMIKTLSDLRPRSLDKVNRILTAARIKYRPNDY